MQKEENGRKDFLFFVLEGLRRVVNLSLRARAWNFFSSISLMSRNWQVVPHWPATMGSRRHRTLRASFNLPVLELTGNQSMKLTLASLLFKRWLSKVFIVSADDCPCQDSWIFIRFAFYTVTFGVRFQYRLILTIICKKSFCCPILFYTHSD